MLAKKYRQVHVCTYVSLGEGYFKCPVLMCKGTRKHPLCPGRTELFPVPKPCAQNRADSLPLSVLGP
jgi:hypothetical protein